mmetsp:Transcript_28429/g.67292  ORF Transcript_28429/g.67292 Transcript_28429/m.67292 type:complete len:88 (-) Transcript_28429:398-661(-)
MGRLWKGWDTTICVALRFSSLPFEGFNGACLRGGGCCSWSYWETTQAGTLPWLRGDGSANLLSSQLGPAIEATLLTPALPNKDLLWG